jgi:tetratricopeptide (TPR) repeat protein
MFSNKTAKTLAKAFNHYQSGQLEEAQQLYEQELMLQPNQIDALQCLGMIAAQQGKPAIAISYFQRAVQAQPAIASHHYNLGYALQTEGDLVGAITAYQRVLNLEPQHLAACYNLATLQLGIGNPAAAIDHYQTVLQLQPDLVAAHTNLGSAYLDLGMLELAIASYQAALVLKPNQLKALYNLGLIYQTQGNLSQAIACYQKLLALEPNDTDALIRLGSVYLRLGEVEAAIGAYQQAVNLAPDNPAAHSGLATSLMQKPDLARSIYHYDQACQCDRQNVEAHFNRAIALLLSGDVERGFAEYEWRIRQINAPKSGWEFDRPRWEGEDLRGRTLLLHPEQGFGDAIQFIRYLPLIIGGQVIIECYRPLRRLFSSMAGINQLYTDGDPVPTYDLQAPLLSLPKLFGTTLSTIPAQVPYLVPPPGVSIPGLDLDHAQKRVGMVWASSSHSATADLRSCRLEMFVSLATHPGLRLYSLQVGHPATDTQLLQANKIIDLSPSLRDFADTAAAIAALDLVITIDTAVAHLAGALGKPVWVLLPYIPDWRWLLNRSDSPWYPTMRLFRQPRPGDWAGAWSQVELALEDFCQGR